MKKYLLAILVLSMVAVLAYVALPKEADTTVMRTISIGGTVIYVDVADTEVLREQGLCGRLILPEGRGMLFVFENDDTWGIWMKDMLFSIDIVWVDASGTVITVAAHVAPDTYPKSFYPSAPARYVLELPAGFAAAHDIRTGSILKF